MGFTLTEHHEFVAENKLLLQLMVASLAWLCKEAELNWVLISAIIGSIGGLAVGVASVVQIIQYIEQRRASQKTVAEQSYYKSSDRTNVPQNLPPKTFFIGRADKQEEVFSALHSSSRLIVVEGAGGIGKTSLALEVAFRCLNDTLASEIPGQEKTNQFNAFVWTTAKASHVTLDSLLDIVARTLDYPYIQPLDLTKKHDEVLKLLRKIKTLIIIDNFETITDDGIIQFVEDVPDPSKVLITTRYQITWGKSYCSINLNKLKLDEGIELIRDESNRLGIKLSLQVNQSSIVELYEATGGSPLAIKWALGQIKQGGQMLSSVLGALKSARGDIFEAMFARSWQLLSGNSKQLLLAMPLFAANVSRDALSATTNIHSFDFDEALSQLVKLWLVELNGEISDEKQQLSLHPLTLSFVARELSLQTQLEIAMRLRAVEYYLQFCNERRYFQRGAKGYDELEAEVANISKLLDYLYEDCKNKQAQLNSNQYIINFSNAINAFFWSRGYWSERVSICTRALEASKSLNAWASAGRQAYFIGIVRFWQGALEEAESWALESKSFMALTTKPIHMALTEHLFGLVLIGKGEHEQAATILEGVLDKISQSGAGTPEELRIFADWRCPGPDGYKAGIASIIQDLGINAYEQRDYVTALKWLDNSIILAQDIGGTEGFARALSHRGHALLGLGKIKDAKESYERGLELATQVQRKSTMGRCNQGLADVAVIEGRVLDAIHYGRIALNLFERLGMRKEKEYVLNLLSAL